ncbi:MAG: hypothetical protein MI717_02470 [Spirochaetales bacterium]|nr:hypothetical protein [Spirochaetales bacterium]
MNYAEEAKRFYAIQLARYLSSRPSGRFSGAPEHDAVMAMIRDSWVELRSQEVLHEMNDSAREVLYTTTLIAFPTFIADSGLRCIPVDFISGRRLGNSIIAIPVHKDVSH